MPTDLTWSTNIIDTLPLSVLCLDANGVITQLNKCARNQLHLAYSDALRSHIHPDSEQQFLDVMANPSTEIQIQLIDKSNSHQVQMSQQSTLGKLMSSFEILTNNSRSVLSCSRADAPKND